MTVYALKEALKEVMDVFLEKTEPLVGRIVKQHTRRMMAAQILAALMSTYKDVATKGEGRVRLAQDAIDTADFIIKQTKELK